MGAASKFIYFLLLVIFLSSCASSKTPSSVNYTLPKLTKSKFLTVAQAEENVANNKCKYLVQKRTYAAPIGITAKSDLKYAAKGIDEWVKLDGGNSYVLRNYNWVTVDGLGTSQLKVEFDTMLCEEGF